MKPTDTLADWARSSEYKHALLDWLTMNGYSREVNGEGIPLMAYKDWIEFPQSEQFRNARLAYRRRLNASPWAETT